MRARVFTAFITVITMLAAIVPQAFAVSVDYTMQIGDTRTIYANVAGYSNVTGGYWSSNSPAVEIVSQSSAAHMCTVKAVESTGSTYAYVEYRFTYTISASTGMTATGMKGYRIAVEAPEPESVGLSPARLSLNVGEGAQLTPSLYPADAETTYSYSSGNIDVATVSQSGYVTAVGGGSTNITVTTANGKTAQTSVTVSYPALRVVSVSPSGGAAEAEPDTDVVFTFNTRIEKGTDFDSIALSDLTDGTVTDTVCSISGNTLTINPVQELKSGHSYRAELPEGAVVNPDGGTAGYTTEFSVKAMSIAQTIPENGSEGVSVSDTLRIEFDRSVERGDNWDKISLLSQYGAADMEKSIAGNSVIISPERLMNNTEYKLTIPVGALKNSEGGSNTVEYYLVFITEKSDVNFVGSVPENGAAGVDTDTDISVSFDYELSEGESFSSVSLKECIWNTAVDGAAYIDGSRIVFVPSAELERGVTYELSIPKGAVKNSEGFINEKYTVIRFTTADTAAVLAAPVISPNGGSIGSGSVISISAEDGAAVYYTINGGDPAAEGGLYIEPITADKDLRTVRAVAVKDGAVSGEARADFSVTDTITAVFGGSENDYFYDAAFDGSGFAAVGYSDGGFGTGDLEGISGSGYTDAVIVKYDSSMQREWVKTYGGSGSDRFNAVAAVSDGYVAVGNTYRGTGMVNTGVIRKYGKDGDVKWTKYISSEYNDNLCDVIATSDGGAIAVGMRGLELSGTSSTDFSDSLLQKYTSSGAVSWSRTADNGRNESFNSVAADDDVIFCAGHASESIYADKYAAVSAYTSGGVLKWSDTLDSDIVSEFTAAAVAPDGCIAAGYYDNSAVVRKYSLSGEILWTKTLETDGVSCFNSIIPDENGFTALGYASESGIGSGELSDATGKGGNDMLMVRYDHDGNMLSYRLIGGESSEVIYGADTYSDGIIIAGYTSSPGSGDFAGLDGRGGNDAVVMKIKTVYKVEYQDFLTEYTGGSYSITDQIPQKDGEAFAGWTDDEYMKYAKYEPGEAVEVDSDMRLYPVWESEAAQTGSVDITSDASAVCGGVLSAGLYFVPESDTVSVNIKLVYPSCISFAGAQSGFDGLYTYENKGTDTNELTVSCDLSGGAVGAFSGEGCSLARLSFTVSDESADGLYEIEFDGSECFTVDSSYKRREFGALNSCGFELSAPKAKELFINGLGRISGEYTYSVSVFPSSADAEVQWFVSDTETAVIDGGRLTPLKNGSVEITAETADGLKASRTIVIDGLKTYITGLQSDTGGFARDYSETELERVLYVDEAVKSVRLTAEYGGGLLQSENGILYSGIAKEFNIKSLPQVIELTKTEDGFSDTVYTVTVKLRAAEYSVEFINYDGSVLQTVSAEEGAVPQYTGQIPIRPEDERFKYIFSGWSPEIVPAEGDAVYTAQYKRLPKIYSVELNGSSVLVCVPEACECAAAVASYDNGRLTGLEIRELSFASAGESVIETELNGDIKVMLWSGMDDMVPLADGYK